MTQELLGIGERITQRLGGDSQPLGAVVERCKERQLVDFTFGYEITPAAAVGMHTLEEVKKVVAPLGFQVVDRLEDELGAAWTLARGDASNSTVIVAELNYKAGKARVVLTTSCAVPGPGDPVPPEKPVDLSPGTES